MSRYQADKSARRMLLSGYRHHSYEEEKRFLGNFFNGEQDTDLFSSEYAQTLKKMYIDVLGPGRLRAMKNSCICMITIICRAAIEYGVDAELSFALSDYYINEIEKQTDENQLMKLIEEIFYHYYDLVQQEKTRLYSQPVAQAIRYINRSLYQTCTVADIASYIKVSPNYLCALFHEEVGITPSAYICQKKMAEAKNMLSHLGYSITETSDALGYYDVAYFSNVFKKHFGKRPSSLRNKK